MTVPGCLISPMFGGGRFVVDAADFDGTNDYATRGAGLTGAADSKLLTYVVFINPDDVTTQHRVFGPAGDTNLVVDIGSTDGRVKVRGWNSAGTKILDVSGRTLLAAAWTCILASFDMADAAKKHLYFGDTNELDTITTYTDDTLDFTAADWGCGAGAGGAAKFNGGLAEMMFWPGVYIDLSVEANRRMFISSAGKPVDPNIAAISTLGAPSIYFHLDDGETANNFVANNDLGATGGAFTVTGALSTFASSPSD